MMPHNGFELLGGLVLCYFAAAAIYKAIRIVQVVVKFIMNREA